MSNDECSVSIEISASGDNINPKVILFALSSLLKIAHDSIENAHPGFSPLDLTQPDALTDAAADVCSLAGRLLGAINDYLDETEESEEVRLERRKNAA